ncbi:Permease [Candidatus Zixiibacteriota bacterium]|nr:Permease [candidate division Zixibacteria bacterium]
MLKQFADFLVFTVLGLTPGSRLGEALDFFIYDTIKIFLLLITIIFAVAVIRSLFPPEKTRRLLSHRRVYIGNVLAALLGVVTPFCSCSAVPLFIGFVESGVPLGVTISFLISSPMVNEVALILLWGLFGWKIALIYIGTGLFVAITSGIVIGRLKMERYVQDYVYQIKVGNGNEEKLGWKARITYAREYTQTLFKKIWLYVIIGIGIGGFIHGYAPEGFLLKYAGPDNPLGVPIAVLIGVPLYSNAAGIIPIVHALMEKGMAFGTVLAFMMAVTALSLPEAIILKNVLKTRLLATFFGIVAVAIIVVGYLFNAII